MKRDEGHINLVADLESLLLQAEGYEFHDFKNKLYGAPKIALHNMLLVIVDNVKKGKYDNKL
jgi:hypothetical protein